jgi:signal transduction histidine kinase/CheY-like chemotaxis protein
VKSWFDHFVPASAVGDPLLEPRARLMIGLGFLVPLLGFGILAIGALIGNAVSLPKLVMTATLVSLLACPWILKRWGSLAITATLQSLLLAAAVLVAAWYNRGLAASVVPVLVALPLMAAVLGGHRVAVGVGSFLVVACGFLYLAGELAWLPPAEATETEAAVVRILVITASVGTAAVVALVYEAYTSLVTRRLREALAARSGLLACVSHGLRGPLEGILGGSDLLARAVMEPDHQHWAKAIQGASGRLKTLLDDLLELSRLEAGTRPLDHQPVSIALLLQGCLAAARVEADVKGVKLAAQIGEGVNQPVYGDPVALQRVILQLLRDAVASTSDTGSVRLSADALQTSSGQMLLKLRVIDTGIGVPEEARAHLFEAFTSPSLGPCRGTGVGLAVSKGLADLMGGRIGLDAEHHPGASFWFEVPLVLGHETQDPQRSPTPVPSQLEGLRVLVADDDPTNHLLMRVILERAGHRVTPVHDGEEAISMVAGGNFDVVLMDLRMPKVDGLEASRAIRALPGPASQIPIIALTAHAMAERQQACREAGMSRFLSKPVSPRELALILEELRREGAPTRPPSR